MRVELGAGPQRRQGRSMGRNVASGSGRGAGVTVAVAAPNA